MRNDWKPRFKCTFKVTYTENHHEIYSMWFVATTREAARKKAKKYFKETYINKVEIISMSY